MSEEINIQIRPVDWLRNLAVGSEHDWRMCRGHGFGQEKARIAADTIDQLTKERDELVKDIATAVWLHPEWGYTTLPPSTWESIKARGDKP